MGITTGSVSGNSLHIEIIAGSDSVKFDMTVDGNTMTGNAVYTESGGATATIPVTGTRI